MKWEAVVMVSRGSRKGKRDKKVVGRNKELGPRESL